jgi:hypothetical protein
MLKYSLSLILVSSLFIGCGGSSKTDLTDQDEPIEILSSYKDDSKFIKESLNQAGYQNVDNLTKIDENLISFTYGGDNGRHFVVYNKTKGEIVSDIPKFSGNRITSTQKKNIIFDNKTEVDLSNYKRPIVKEFTESSNRPQEQNRFSNEELREFFENQLKSFEWYYSSHVVSPGGLGAVVLIKSDGGASKLIRYGLDQNPPVREMDLVDVLGDISNLEMVGNGKISFYFRSHKVIYDYIDAKEMTNFLPTSENNYYNGYDDGYQEGSYTDYTDFFRNDIDNKYWKWSYETHRITPQGGGAIVLVKSDEGESSLFLYGLEYSPKYERSLLTVLGEISNLQTIGGGKIKFDYNGGTVVFDYIDNEVVSGYLPWGAYHF